MTQSFTDKDAEDLRNACKEGHIDDVKRLLSRTPRQEHEEIIISGNNMHWNALHYAARAGKLEILQYLCQQAMVGNISQLTNQLTLSKFAVETQDKLGDTPMHLAAFNGHFSCVRYLVEICHAEYIDIKNVNGYTPLDYAIWQAKHPLIVYLSDKGAQANKLKQPKPSVALLAEWKQQYEQVFAESHVRIQRIKSQMPFIVANGNYQVGASTANDYSSAQQREEENQLLKEENLKLKAKLEQQEILLQQRDKEIQDLLAKIETLAKQAA